MIGRLENITVRGGMSIHNQTMEQKFFSIGEEFELRTGFVRPPSSEKPSGNSPRNVMRPLEQYRVTLSLTEYSRAISTCLAPALRSSIMDS